MENSNERIRNDTVIPQANRALDPRRHDQRGMVNGPHRVFVEKAGFVEEVRGLAIGEKSLMVAVKNIARRLGDDISESKPVLDSRLPDGVSPSRYPRVSSWLQSEVGIVRDESGRSSSANGTQLCCDDSKIYRRNSTRTGASGLFHHGTGKYGKRRICPSSRLVVYNQRN